ncbi:MAG TPA: amidohydrolase family protein [Woeseiaceae bacterium]|nr:amidohydrolase family protein [Woeseiaceae bacterium]
MIRPLCKQVMVLLLLTAVLPVYAETTAIVGGKVHTVGPQGVLENATIIIRDGLIDAVGTDIAVPAGATRIDAAGKIVTPGLFTPMGNIGLIEVGFSAGPLDYVQRGDQFTASFEVADAFNPRSTLISVNRIEGVTRALVSPAAASMDETGFTSHVISGMAAVANLSGKEDSIDRRDAALIVNLGEGGVEYAGSSRASALLILRNALDEAKDFALHREEFERGEHRDYNFSFSDLTALQRVLSGDIPLLANVDRASDILGLIRLGDEYGLRLIVNSGVEAWLVADELAAANVPVIVAPEANLPSNFDRVNARSDLAAILSKAGVKVAFADGSGMTENARNITQSAGNATVGGMSWDAALRAITLDPAEIYGVADRVGSIEPGKEADVVIWPGDPFELSNYPDQVFIRGEAIEMKSRQTLLRDRYMQTGSHERPAYRH